MKPYLCGNTAKCKWPLKDWLLQHETALLWVLVIASIVSLYIPM